MSFISWFENIVQTTENDVVSLIAKIKQGVQVAEKDIDGALKWVAANAPSISTDIQTVVTLVETAGIVNPQVEAAIAAANVAVAGLNVFAANVKAGNSSAQAVVAGYAAAKNAHAAAASAAATAALSNPTAAPAVPAAP